MTRSRLIAVSTALLVLAAWAPPAAEAFHDRVFHAEARAWFPRLDAEVRSSTSALAGTAITEADLGLDDPDIAPGAAVMVRLLPRLTLRVEGFTAEASGDTRVARTFNFAGETYTVASRVVSDVDATLIAADLGFDVIHTGPVALAVHLGARFADVEARLQAPDLGLGGRVTADEVGPAVGVSLILHPMPAVPLLSSLALVGRVHGFTLGDRAWLIDAEAGIEWLPLPLLAVRAGYRHLRGEWEDGGDRAELELSGPFVGLTLRF